MKYRENMSVEELKEVLVFLSLGTAERFETWLEDFDWRLAPYDHCILVDAAVGKVGNQGNGDWAGRANMNFILGQMKNIVNTNVF